MKSVKVSVCLSLTFVFGLNPEAVKKDEEDSISVLPKYCLPLPGKTVGQARSDERKSDNHRLALLPLRPPRG